MIFSSLHSIAKPLSCWLIGTAIFLAACSPRKLMVNEMVDVLATGMTAMEQDDDLAMLERAFPAHIKQLEGLLISTPENDALLVMLAKSYAAYGFIFLDSELEAMRLEHRATAQQGKKLRQTLSRYYQKGMAYAINALAIRHPQAHISLKSSFQDPSVFEALTATDVPALFWFGFNLSAYVNTNLDSIRTLAKAHVIETAMKRVIDLDETYYHGMAHLVLMAYYGSRSIAMGGNVALAMAHYNRLQDINQKQLWLSDVYLARFIYYQQQNREGYVRVLQQVVDQPESSPALQLLNETARLRARIYLDATDRLFEGP